MITPDLERTRSALFFLSPDMPRDDWVEIAMAVKAELGEEGFEMFDEWSRQSDKYIARDASSIWKSCKSNGGISGATLFFRAKAIGWSDNGTHQKPTQEELTERRRIAAQRAAKDDAERERKHGEARQKAAGILKCARPAPADNPYLLRKSVAPVPSLLEISVDMAKDVLGYAPKSRDITLVGRLLVAPISIDGTLSTVEFIDEAGHKAVIAGCAKSGGYWAAQELPEGDGAGLTILIDEGVATVLSAREATGYLAVAALSCGNLPAVAREMRERYPMAVLGILADLVKDTGEPDPHAIDAARAVGGVPVLPDFGEDQPEGMKDINDMHQLQGREAVAECIRRQVDAGEWGPRPAAHATDEAEGLEATVRRLTGLSPIEYDRVRQADANALGVRVATLDAEVEKARGKLAGGGDGAQGAPVLFPDIDLWPEPVGGANLLADLAATFKRYTILPDLADVALALWAILTHCIDAVNIAPILALTSPEKRCGKSTVLALIGRLALRSLPVANISGPSLFRAVEAWSPALLIDEADTFLRNNDELRGIINSGHTRDLAFVIRTVGDDHEPRRFSTWGAKAIASIGKLSDTNADRSIEICLKRKLPGERTEKLRHADPETFNALARRCARWAADHIDEIRAARPSMPAGLHDRAEDNWEPLLAIADLAGGEWPKRAREAASALSGGDENTGGLGVELLGDIRLVFEDRSVDRISSEDLVLALVGLEERRWAEYSRGKPLTMAKLARLLRPYGVVSGTIRLPGGKTPKGYLLDRFTDPFARYLPAYIPPTEAPHRHNVDVARVSEDFESATAGGCGVSENGPEPRRDAGCGGVADSNPPPWGTRI